MMYLARHGETVWNLAGRYQGRLESALSPLGIMQGQAIAGYFGERLMRGQSVPSRIISSPLLRCTATAQFTAARLAVPLETDGRLIEIAHGTWEGRYRDEIAATDPERYRMWRHDPGHVAFEGGETLVDVQARWLEFAVTLHENKADVFVCTHDAVVRAALLAAMRRPLDDFWKLHVENGAFARLEMNGSEFVVVDECCAEHLASMRASTERQAL